MSERLHGVGIDLGTSNSSVCKVDMHTGAPHVKFARDPGGPQIASAVHLDTNGAKTFGATAEQFSRNPDEALRVVSNFKLLLRNNEPVNLPDGSQVLPDELMRGFLAFLKQCYESTFHETCERAVITVPASEDFDFDYRQRVRNAVEGRDGGGPLFTSFTTLPEPDAVLRSFADLTEFIGKDLLVFDMGGGTLDVTIRHVDRNEAGEILLAHRAIAGSAAAGVRITQALTNHLLDLWERSAGVTFTKDDRTRALQANHFPIDDAKKKLSGLATQHGLESNAQLQFRVDFAGVKPGHFTANITAKTLTELCRPVCEEAIETVEKALGDAGLMSGDIDHYFAVGGSVALPLMQARLFEFFGGREPSSTMGSFGSFDAVNAVAQGAAFHDLLRSDAEGNVPNTTLDRAGVLEQKQPYSVALVVDQHRNTEVLVKKDTVLPIAPERRKLFMPVTDDNIDIVLVRGEGDPSACEHLARRTIWFDAPVRAGAEISVSWLVTEGGELEIRAFDQQGEELFVMVQKTVETES